VAVVAILTQDLCIHLFQPTQPLQAQYKLDNQEVLLPHQGNFLLIVLAQGVLRSL
jgi:hypothetical protein